MFTLKSKKSIALVAACATLLTGCFPTSGELLSTKDNSALSEQIEEIVSENDNLEINVQVNENTVSELPKLNVKVMDWDEEKLKNIFLTGKTDVEYTEFQSDFFSNDKHHLYEEGDQYWLGFEPGELTAEDRMSKAFGYRTLGTFLGYFCLDEFFTDDSISVLPKDEAIKRCTDLLEKVGITNYGEPEVYAITVDKANEFWKAEEYDEIDGYADWTSEEDEVYIMRFPIQYNGVPVTTDDVNSSVHGQGGFFVGTYIDCIVTKDKVFSIDAWHIFSPEYELGENVKINCSSANALKIAAEHYAGVDLNGQSIKIVGCDLVYVPYEQHDEKNFTLIPMWKIDSSLYMEGDFISNRDCLFIDAQTGNVIVW